MRGIEKAFVLLAAVPSAAHADLTAIYVAPNTSYKMTVEIASDGDVRGDVGKLGMYFITRSGQGYLIQNGPSGPLVSRIEDIATVMSEQMAKLDPHFREEMAQHAPVLNPVRKGTMTVNGRTGDAYFMQMGDRPFSPKPWFVISHDAGLAPLARAMAGQFAMSMKTMSQAMGTGPYAKMEALLQTGAPIVFTGAELQSISDLPIPASEFTLPAAPQTLEQVRGLMAAQFPK